MRGKSLYDFPIHLGLGAKAIAEPQFTGFEWYEEYGNRHADDLDEGRLVSMFRFEESWTSWEMHPAGDEVVCCLQGEMTLHQELPDGSKRSYELGPGEYAINPPAPGTPPMRMVRSWLCSSPSARGLRTVHGSRIGAPTGVWPLRESEGGEHEPQIHRLQGLSERIQLLHRDFGR